MGGEKFDTPHPEGYLFGENMDLNFLGNRPVQASSYIMSVLLFFVSCLFWKILCGVCGGGWHRPKRSSLLGECHSSLFRCKLSFPVKLNSPLRLIFAQDRRDQWWGKKNRYSGAQNLGLILPACLSKYKTCCREGQEAESELPKAPGHVGWLPASVQHMLFSVSMSGLTRCRAVLRQSLLFCGFYT